MDIIRAKEIVRSLADGVDPTTGEVLPAENVYNSPEIIRALFTLLEQTENIRRYSFNIQTFYPHPSHMY